MKKLGSIRGEREKEVDEKMRELIKEMKRSWSSRGERERGRGTAMRERIFFFFGIKVREN